MNSASLTLDFDASAQTLPHSFFALMTTISATGYRPQRIQLLDQQLQCRCIGEGPLATVDGVVSAEQVPALNLQQPADCWVVASGRALLLDDLLAIQNLISCVPNRLLAIEDILQPQQVGALLFAVPQESLDTQRLIELASQRGLDINVLTERPHLDEPGILLMDMDSTAIQIECIDEIAKLAGVGEQVAAVTAAAMQGKLDFAESLRARVATLEGQSEQILAEVGANIPYTQGIREMIAKLKARRWKVAVVSGGFTYFTDIIAQELGLDFTRANKMLIEEGVLQGAVEGEIVDAQVKSRTLKELSTEYTIPLAQTVAAGDGANDLVMMATAQLGVACHAKPVVKAQADSGIDVGGLEGIFYLLATERDAI